MAYAFTRDVPVDAATYAKIRAGLGEETPKGLIVHLAVERDGGLRYVDVWDSEEDWHRFQADRLMPVIRDVLGQAGIVPDPSQAASDELVLVDVWQGS